jgi:opacity protein-like surface antigen
MGKTKALLVAALVAAGASSAASAADLLPPPPPLPPPAPLEVGGWYLRGDVGVGAVEMSDWRSTLQPFDELGNPLAGNLIAPAFASIGDQSFAGIGVGYQVNGWFRADITGEYRTEASYRAGILAANPGSGFVGADVYNAGVSGPVFLANGYFDLGTWRGVTPFVGGGVGLANLRLSNLSDSGTGFGLASDRTQTNFAWAVMGGLALAVTPNLKLELGYRYLDMGRVTSNPIQCLNPQGCFREVHSFNVASNDVRLGFRYLFGGPVLPPPPLITKY